MLFQKKSGLTDNSFIKLAHDIFFTVKVDKFGVASVKTCSNVTLFHPSATCSREWGTDPLTSITTRHRGYKT